MRTRWIPDRYIEATLLRLRELTDERGGAQQRLITTICLSEGEFCLLSQLPGEMLRKGRYSVSPLLAK